ncbi:zgc:153031 isoform X2 [Takifugu flavidus]|uniref:zgc:153031 isoform X2 n=1 Tax=Takifugu flavidus TaxID=433684 RepID=UPI002544038D|nr:zgc:153031 isoform X2 [Takifugu flavidus]
MKVEQEGIRLWARPCGSRVTKDQRVLTKSWSCGRRQLRSRFLKSPFTHARSVRVASPDPVPLTRCLLEMEAAKGNKKPVRVIAAVCNNRGIGKDNQMPWSIPAEFQYFLNTVTRVSRPGNMNMMVWGKQCWVSHPDSTFPLPNILHAVLSKTLLTVPDHAHFVCESLDAAVRLASEPPLADLIEIIWIVGGVQVYKEAMEHPWCDLIYLTDIMAEFECDVFFPEFDKKLFEVQDSFPDVPNGIQEDNGIKYKCQVYKRKTAEHSCP